MPTRRPQGRRTAKARSTTRFVQRKNIQTRQAKEKRNMQKKEQLQAKRKWKPMVTQGLSKDELKAIQKTIARIRRKNPGISPLKLGFLVGQALHERASIQQKIIQSWTQTGKN